MRISTLFSTLCGVAALIGFHSVAVGEDFSVDFSIDGKAFHVDEADISTSYRGSSDGSAGGVFKIFAGSDGSPQLVLTIPRDMSKPSTVPSGSVEPGNEISQGSVSLQGYPAKGDIYNNFDHFADPVIGPVENAIVVTSSEKVGEVGRIVAGTINTVTVPDASSKDKGYAIVGTFRVKHIFSGEKF